MLKSLVPHFYPKMHLDDYWRPLFRNPPSLHIPRLSVNTDNTPARQALLRQVEFSVGRTPGPTRKNPRGRRRAKWTDQLRRDNNNVPIATLCRDREKKFIHHRANNLDVTIKINLCGRLPGRKFPSSWPPMLIQIILFYI